MTALADRERNVKLISVKSFGSPKHLISLLSGLILVIAAVTPAVAIKQAFRSTGRTSMRECERMLP
jgi:hypothetical protein